MSLAAAAVAGLALAAGPVAVPVDDCEGVIHKLDDKAVTRSGVTRAGHEWWHLETVDGVRYADPGGWYGGQNANLRCEVPRRPGPRLGPSWGPQSIRMVVPKVAATSRGPWPVSVAHVTVNVIVRGPNREVLFLQHNVADSAHAMPGWRERANGYRVTTVGSPKAGTRWTIPVKSRVKAAVRQFWPGTRLRDWEVVRIYVGTETSHELDETAGAKFGWPAWTPMGSARAVIRFWSLEAVFG